MESNDAYLVINTMITHLINRQKLQAEVNEVHLDQHEADMCTVMYLQSMIARWMQDDPKIMGDVLMRSIHLSEDVERMKQLTES